MTTPRKSKKRLGLVIVATLGALLLLCVGVAAIVAMLGDNTTDSARVAAGLNTPARDGKFEFTVTKIQCGVPRIGQPPLGATAQGQFCLVSVTVRNIGGEAQSFFAGNQYAFNSAGQKYSADTTTGIYLTDGDAFLNDINPGNTVTGTIVYDIPVGQTIVRLELHDSAFSGGVRVNVG